MDAYTLYHLDQWLDLHAREDERAELRAQMVHAVTIDPELLDKGWTRVRDIVVGR